jgi:hypothetical protein
MTKKLQYPVLALALGATLLLGGCTFQIAGPDDDREPSSTSKAPEKSSPPSDSSDDDETDTNETDDDETGSESERERLEDLVNVTLQCEPGLEISSPGASVRVEGDCGTVTVSGDATVVIADDIESLVVSASGAVIYVGSLDSVQVTGDANTVYWTGPTPAVDDDGAGNVLEEEN